MWGNEDRAGKRENEAEGEKEAKKERVRFCFFALVIPSEIDSHSSRDLPLSPFSPSSRLYYIPVQRMNDLHITHEYC